MNYILIIMSFCVLWSSAQDRLSSENIYSKKNDVRNGSMQHCFCYTGNSNFGLVRDRINPNKNPLKRLVAYFYINEYTNRVSIYIPNQEIQNGMPDINYHNDDIVSDITDGFSLNSIVTHPYAIRYNGKELPSSDSIRINNETSTAVDFPTKDGSKESIRKYPHEAEYLRNEDRVTQKYNDTTEDFTSKYLPRPWDNNYNNNNYNNNNTNNNSNNNVNNMSNYPHESEYLRDEDRITQKYNDTTEDFTSKYIPQPWDNNSNNVKNINNNNKSSMWLPQSVISFDAPNYEEDLYQPQYWESKWPNNSSVTQYSNNFVSEGEYYHRSPEVGYSYSPQHKYLDPYNKITKTKEEFPYHHSQYPNGEQLNEYFVPQQHVPINSDATKLFKNQYKPKIQKLNDEYSQYVENIKSFQPTATWISKIEHEPTKNKENTQSQYAKWPNKFDEYKFEPSVTAYESMNFPNDKHNRPTDTEIKFINHDPQTLESNRYNLVIPSYSNNSHQEYIWPQKHSLPHNSHTQFWPNKHDEDNNKPSDTYFYKMKFLNDKYNIPTNTEFEFNHSDPQALEGYWPNLVTPTYLNNTQHPEVLWPQKHLFYSQSPNHIPPKRHKGENKNKRPHFLEYREQISETVPDSSTKVTEVTLDKLTRDKWQHKPNNANLHNIKNPAYLEHQFAEGFGLFNSSRNNPYSSLLKHIQNISKINTFDTWYNKEIKCVESNLQMVAALDLSELKVKLKKTLVQNGITVSNNGVLKDSNGAILNLNNLKLQPVLIGNAFSFDKFMSFVKVHKRVGLPPSFYLQAVIITAANPMKILGIVPLGVLNLPKQIPIQILESQYSISKGIDTKPYKANDQSTYTLAIAQTKNDRMSNYVGNTVSMRPKNVYVPQNNIAEVLTHFYENYDKRNYVKVTDYTKLDDIYELKNIDHFQKPKKSNNMLSYRMIIGGNTATGSGRPISNRGRSARRNLMLGS